MTPPHTRRAADLVTRWVRCYTGQLPPPVVQRRRAELRADLHDLIDFELAAGTGDRRIALSVLSRMVRGLPADAVWRGRIRPWRGDLMRSFATKLGRRARARPDRRARHPVRQRRRLPGLVLIGLLLIVGAFAIGVRTGHRRGQGITRRQSAEQTDGPA
jgi:hypothetical protein